jgi:hypothetical protein
MVEFPRKCPNCRERQLNLVTELYETTFEHDGREYKISIPLLEFLSCSACGNRILPNDSEDIVLKEFRKTAGLLEPHGMVRSERRNV